MSPKKRKQSSSPSPLAILAAVSLFTVVILALVLSSDSSQLRTQVLSGSGSPTPSPEEKGACYNFYESAQCAEDMSREECDDRWYWRFNPQTDRTERWPLWPLDFKNGHSCYKPGEQCKARAPRLKYANGYRILPISTGLCRAGGGRNVRDEFRDELQDCWRQAEESMRLTCEAEGGEPEEMCRGGEGLIELINIGRVDGPCNLWCVIHYTCEPKDDPPPSPPPFQPPPLPNNPSPPVIVLPSGSAIPLPGPQFQPSGRRSFPSFFQGLGSFFRRR